jgi:hypothetical protein
VTNKNNCKIPDCAIKNKSVRRLKKDQDKKFTEDIGRSMRFFLNLSFVLMFAFSVFVIFDSHPKTTLSVIIALTPLVTTIIFFLVFLRLLKRIEQHAVKKRNIELVSRITWEFNKSYLIRSIIGKIKAFIEEE